EKDEVLEIAHQLNFRKRRAHNRSIENILEVIDQVGHLWRNPNYDIRKETIELLPMITGQSQRLCEIELNGTLILWEKKYAEGQLNGELGGKMFLDEWILKNNVRLHAQPRGVVLHNLAGNAFNLGMLSLFYGLVTKNVNLIKLSHEEPLVTVKLCETISDVDKKIAKEIAALYWRGSNFDIYDSLFQSSYIDTVLAWGGINSIEDIRRRAYQYGIKIINHGPKMSFAIVSEDYFKSIEQMRKIAFKVAFDTVFWNQKACLSPRVIYIVENTHSPTFYQKNEIFNDDSIKFRDSLPFSDALNNTSDQVNYNDYNLSELMQRSIKTLKNNITEISPYGFAKMIAEGMKKADEFLPQENLTQADGMEVAKKRQYFFRNYVSKKRGKIITPINSGLNWTVVFLRDLPNAREIDMCQNRFLIITRVSSINDLIYSIRNEKLHQYLQTISVLGSDDFIKHIAEEFSLLGAFRFPRIGEHNIQSIGTPWDGHYVLQDMIKWVYISFVEKENDGENGRINMFDGFPSY
ncbi:MAG: acyl-CoA reductase, partial [Candidatus Lokiarchaeota archaeon]